MQIIKTIEQTDHIIETGNRPVVVMCEDFNDWVCKYDYSTKNLFNEVVASRFANIWQISTPEIALIKVKPEHISERLISTIQPYMIEKECFGSLYLKDSNYLDLTTIPLFSEKTFTNRIINKYDFLKIALFDIWLSNDDRNYNNFNMLLKFLPGNYVEFVAIDHGAIFNTNNLHLGLYIISEDETIINTDISKKLFAGNKQLIENVDKLIGNFYLCVAECKSNVEEILLEIPDSWNIDIIEYKRLMSNQLFSREWLKQCETTFRHYIQLFIIN